MAVDDVLQQFLKLTVNAFDLAPRGIKGGACLDTRSIYLARELLAEDREERRIHQPVAQGVQHAGLEPIPPDVDAVGADALVARRGAADQVCRDHRIAASAAAAAGQAREEVLRPAPVPEVVLDLASVRGPRGLDGPLPRLDGLPELVVDDPQLGHVLADPFALRIGTRHALAGVGVLDEALPVPDQPADVHLVVEDAVAPLRIAIDRAEAPGAAARRRDAGAVQLDGDALGRLPGRIVAKDPPHYVRFGLVDDVIASDRLAVRGELLDDVVAVAVAAAGLALLDTAAQAAPCLVGQVLQEEGVHRALEADMQLGDLTLGESDHRDARKAQALVETGDVLLVAGQPVQRLGEHEVEAAAQRVVDQRLDARAQDQRGTADRLVGILFDDPPALLLRMQAADSELVGDRGDALIVGRIAGVDGDPHGSVSSVLRSRRGRSCPAVAAPRPAPRTSAARPAGRECAPVRPGVGPAARPAATRG